MAGCIDRTFCNLTVVSRFDRSDLGSQIFMKTQVGTSEPIALLAIGMEFCRREKLNS